MTATFFTPDLFAFLKQLKRNNHREWFAKNKSRYEECVVRPALAFISEFAAPLHEISPHFVADARPTRGSLFRIYRDTRFSPDKRPYKTFVGIHFSHAQGKQAHAPVRRCFTFTLNRDSASVAPESGILTTQRSPRFALR